VADKPDLNESIALFNRWKPFWEHQWDGMEKCADFVAGARFEDDHGAYEKDRRLAVIIGEEINDEIRHIVAKATEKPRSIEARPIDKIDDPDVSEVWVGLLEWLFGRSCPSFENPYERSIQDCRTVGQGIVWMDYDPDEPPERSIKFRRGDPRRFAWDPAYWDDPHHPDCNDLFEVRRVPVDKAKKLWKKDWIVSDQMAKSIEGRADRPIAQQANADRGPRAYDDDSATFLLHWIKRDDTEGYEKDRREEPLDDGDRYLACADECGYRSETESELQASNAIEGGLPDMLEAESEDNPGGGCPECGGMLKRVDATYKTDFLRKYTGGRKLCISAMNCIGPDSEYAYEGPWPIANARSFPIFSIQPYPEPGDNDVKRKWYLQLASDKLRTLAVQRVFEHRNYWIMPAVGINDAQGRRFQFREDQSNVMFRDASVSQQWDTQVDMKNGTGLDPGWSIAFQATQAALTQFSAKADFGPAEENTRDIAVGTTQTLVKEAEIPTAHFNRRKNRALSAFYSVAADYMKFVLTPDFAARLRIEGIDLVVGMHGESLPDMDFIIEDTPEFMGLDDKKAAAFQTGVGILQQFGPETFEVWAEFNNVPRSFVRRLVSIHQQQQQEAEQEALQADQEQQEAGIPPGFEDMAGQGPGAAGGTGPGPETEMQGAGMEPAPF
jgi:hypothetical protein